MNGQRGQLSRLIGRALLSLAASAVAVTLLAPTATASPIGDAEAAMMEAWDKAGGDTSTLGARKGDVYPVGDGFALDFDGGKMFFTPQTGAKYMYGPILAKYDELGGPADSDLGFPTINEVPGLAGPDSRVSTFSASDNPVIFWTPDHGAFVVRGAMNAAWDKLGSSGGVLGAPIGDATFDGEVTSQKFTGGEVSWNRQTKEFTTTPTVLADQLKDLQVAIDPTAAINMAWRAAGGATGPLGARKGAQYPIGGDGIAQDFEGGKVFFSPATGANAVEGEILAKYESLGGPVSSDLGFPTANESDGGIEPASRVAAFSAADKPVIFWTPDHGAFVVRGAMKVAWDKLKGATGKLGAPVADQTEAGDVVSQKFTGGTISWNRATNSFSTDPANLAPLLSGLQVSGQNQPSTSAAPPHSKKFTWHWWWLAAAIPVLLLVVFLVVMAVGLRRRRAGQETHGYEPAEHDAESGYDAIGGQWPHDELDFGSEHFPPDDHDLAHAASDSGTGARVSWPRGGGGPAYGEEMPPSFHEDFERDEFAHEDFEHEDFEDEDFEHENFEHEDFGADDEDPDAVDTTPTPVISIADLAEAVRQETAVPETAVTEAFGLPHRYVPEPVVPETAAPEAAVPETAVHEDDFPKSFMPGGGTADATTEIRVLPEAAGSPRPPRAGRHAAAETVEDDSEDEVTVHARQAHAPAAAAAGPSAGARPTIHMPLDHDPYQAPEGYPIKASARFGLYYTPSSALYYDTLAEIWFATEAAAQANGFIKAD